MEENEEVIIVKGTDINLVMLENIRQTYNKYAEYVNENPKWTMNMSTYCRDVHFLLFMVCELNRVLQEKPNGTMDVNTTNS